MKRILRIIKQAAIIGTVVAAIGVPTVLVLHKLGEVKPPSASIDSIHAQKGIPVKVEAARVHTFVRYMYCDGDIVARERAMLRAVIGEIVETVTVLPGEHVKKGQVLVTFRRADIESQIEAAKVACDETEKRHKRYTELHSEGVATPEQVERAATAWQEAQTRCALLESQLEFTEIRSPINGVVEQRWVEPGEKKMAKDELMSLLAPDALDVRALVPERYRADLKLGMTGAFQFIESERSSGEWRSAQITRMAPSTMDPNRFFEVYLKLDKPGRALVGRYVEVRFGMGIEPGALSVSSDALVYDGPRRAVYVVEPDTAEVENEAPDESGLLFAGRAAKESYLATVARGLRKVLKAIRVSDGVEPNGPVMKREVVDVWRARRVGVTPGMRDERRVQIVGNGLTASMRVVMLPADDLRDGSVVRIIEPEQGAE